MLTVLPTEIVISIFAYLPLDSLRKIPLICKQWRTFFSENESIFYHSAALLHGYSPSSEVTLEDAAKRFSKRTMGNVGSWKDYSRKRLFLEKSWAGKAPTSTTLYKGSGNFVHRIKLDEQVGLLVSTNGIGGLTVCSLATCKPIWGLPRTHVRRYAHLEYTQGFIVFDCLDGSKEVWRRVMDFPNYPTDPADLASFDPTKIANESVLPDARPNAKQISAGETASSGVPFSLIDPTALGVDNNPEGRFRPWAHLVVPHGDNGRAYRLADNFILGVSSISKVYLWDVRTGELVQTISDTQRSVKMEMFPDSNGVPQPVPQGFVGDITVDWAEEDDTLGGINYIELNDEFVFLCGEESLRVFDRRNAGKCVMHLLPGGMIGRGWFKLGEYERDYHGRDPGKEDPLIEQELQYHEVKEGEPGHGFYDDSFSAVHVSACGKHLAIMTSNSRLILLPYFKRCLSTTQSRLAVHEVAVEIIMGDIIWDNAIVQDAFLYLAFTGDRIGAATNNGIYIVRPNWDGLCRQDLATLVDPENADLDNLAKNLLSVHRVSQLNDLDNPDGVSCLQLTETGLFIVWDPQALPGVERQNFHLGHKTVVSVDFWQKEDETLASEEANRDASSLLYL